MVFEDEMHHSYKARSRFGWVYKLLFFLCVLFAIGITILSSLGGNQPAIKEGLEGYISQASNMQASIGTLNRMDFFPSVTIDISDITFTSGETQEKMLSIESIYVSTSFWNIFFRRSAVSSFEVKEVQASKGLYAPRTVRIRKMELSPAGYKGEPAFISDGFYGEEPFSIIVQMNGSRKIISKGVRYSFGKDNYTEFKLGNLIATGYSTPDPRGGVRFDFDRLGSPDSKVSGFVKYVLQASRKKSLSMLLKAEGIEFEIESLRDLYSRNISIYFKSLDIDDFVSKDLVYLAKELQALFKDPKDPFEPKLIDLSGREMTIKVEASNISKGQTKLGTLSLQGNLKDSTVTIDSFKGTLAGAKPRGKIVLDAHDLPAQMTLDFALDDISSPVFGQAYFEQGDKGGAADLIMSLKGQGDTVEQILNSLTGDAVIIAGDSRFDSNRLNEWGGRIVKAMLPDFSVADDLSLHCLISNFRIEEGLASPSPLFLDAKRIIVVGDGHIDIKGREIYLNLKPKSKNHAFETPAIPITIKGDLFHPSISNDTAGIGIKFSDVSSGMIDSSIWAYSLTDLGITERHSCFKYFIVPNPAVKKDFQKEQTEIE